ncbi:molybdopterin dinucleotide binding domain-containing protein [Halomicroarcula sp. GCM10025709]|uniref:molybdopterin dinucleotide binding domain-containing protein n=1 Tax=Halomicroarcula sp. GCM10025709 TaxID=3252669 RepID=UPI00361C4AF9
MPEPTDPEYPLLLTTGRRAGAYNTGVRNRETGEDVPRARINPQTAGQYVEVLDRGRTVVESRRASVTVTLVPDDGIPPGAIWLDVHHPSVNDLTLPAIDPDSNEPNYKQCAVRLAAPDRSPPVARDGVVRTGTVVRR